MSDVTHPGTLGFSSVDQIIERRGSDPLDIDQVMRLRAFDPLDVDQVIRLRAFDPLDVDEVIRLRAFHPPDVDQVIRLRAFDPLDVDEVIDLRTSAPEPASVDVLDDHRVEPIELTAVPVIYAGKRVVDLLVLSAAAPLGMCIAAMAAVAIKFTSPGPVLFRQPRMGLGGEEFTCLKFRTMVHGDNPLIPDASRITSVGKWLRRFSLDELPQLLNVARGDMSMVGPRPMLRFQAERCSSSQMRRMSVRPGLTGWAQINGRNALSWAERIELDLDYIDRQAAAFDLKIVLGTAQALLSGAGVEGHDAADPFAMEPESAHG